MQDVLNFTSVKDDDCQKAFNAIKAVLSNPNNIIEKTHEAYGDMYDEDVFIVWSAKGQQICVIPQGARSLLWKNINMLFPKDVASQLSDLLRKRAIDTSKLKTIKTNIFISNMQQFTK